MALVLVIDDDAGTRDTFAHSLRIAAHDVLCSDTGSHGIQMALDTRPDVALVDLKLPDMSGIEVVRTLRRVVPSLICLMMTGAADFESVVEAMRVGVRDYLRKPVWTDDVIDAVNRALPSSHSPAEPELGRAEPHALTRWAEVIVKFTASTHDVKNLAEFGHYVGVSAGTFKNWCRTAGVGARRSLWFARGLRAVERQRIRGEPPAHVLRFVDLRTLSKFLVSSGGSPERLPDTVEAFLRYQQFIRNPEAIAAVRTLFERDVERHLDSIKSNSTEF